ncbi:MAG: DNA polymerase III subunit gamma/tau [Clostridia bacterium]|nr:DNA polymerase III subunit gamma/tau [Clostridia bacterium]
MAYLALYRSFRPTSLQDVVRQEHIVTVLKNQIETGRVGHAYLFCGPRGTGKTSIAKIFAASINCETPVNGSPCGKCAVCEAMKDPSNLDISEIDAASNNGVEEMRDLREKVQYPPVSGKYKVYIIDEVHMLSTGAFNALLKTLEEPPAHAVFILATTEAHKIPATILSRCMRFDFKLIPQSDLENRLKFVLDSIGKPYEETAIAALARAGAGSVRDMLSLADTCLSYSKGTLTYADVMSVIGSADRDAVTDFCAAFLSGNAGDAFERAEALLNAGKSVGMLLKDVMGFLNACAVAKTCRNAQTLLALPDAEYAKIKSVADATDGHTLLRATEIFAKVEPDLKYSTSPRILFETAVLKASMPQTDYDVEALLSRIALLEKKLAEGKFAVSSAPAATVITPTATNLETNVETNATAERPTRVRVERVEEPVYDAPSYEPPAYMDPPPEEEYGGYYEPTEPRERPKKPTAARENPVRENPVREEPVRETPVQTVEKPKMRAAAGDAKAAFGSFLRALRRTAKNGVLFTICMELEYEYEGDTLVLYCDKETMLHYLKREENYALVKQAFATIDVAESGFDIRLRGTAKDEFQNNVQAVRNTFPNTPVDVQ